MNKEESPPNLCFGALTPLNGFLHVAYERIAEQMEDLSSKALTHTSCTDCGFGDGGFGRVVMHVTAEIQGYYQNLQIEFQYPDGPFYNTFTWDEKAGTWTSRTESADEDGKRALFAEDTYRRP